MNNDKRKAPRLKAYHLIKYKLLSDEENRQEAAISNIKDIGEGGVSFKIDEPVVIGNMMELKVQFPPLSAPISTLAKVVWVKKLPRLNKYDKSDKYEIGVQFLSIEDNMRKTIAEKIDSTWKKIEES